MTGFKPRGAGLLVDRAALTDGDDSRIRRIRCERIANGRITPAAILQVGRTQKSSPVCSGVLMFARELGFVVATAAHSERHERAVMDESYFVLGLQNVDQDVAESQIFEFVSVNHFEDVETDRDLTILRVQALDQSPLPYDLPTFASEAWEPGVDQRINISGHPGGGGLATVAGHIEQRVPTDPKRALRGLNLLVDDPKLIGAGMSGAPVYDAKGTTVLGIFQRQSWSELKALRALLDSIDQLELAADHVANLFGRIVAYSDHQTSASGISLRQELLRGEYGQSWPQEVLARLSCDASPVESVSTTGCQDESIAEAARRALDPLVDELIAVRLGASTRANATFLGGALSSNFYR